MFTKECYALQKYALLYPKDTLVSFKTRLQNNLSKAIYDLFNHKIFVRMTKQLQATRLLWQYSFIFCYVQKPGTCKRHFPSVVQSSGNLLLHVLGFCARK